MKRKNVLYLIYEKNKFKYYMKNIHRKFCFYLVFCYLFQISINFESINLFKLFLQLLLDKNL